MFAYQRKYRETGQHWQDVTEEDARRGMSGNYQDIDMMLRAMRDGLTVRTPFAFYRAISIEGKRAMAFTLPSGSTMFAWIDTDRFAEPCTCRPVPSEDADSILIAGESDCPVHGIGGAAA